MRKGKAPPTPISKIVDSLRQAFTRLCEDLMNVEMWIKKLDQGALKFKIRKADEQGLRNINKT